MTTQYPPLLLKYLKMFQDDPRSRIFAPLAECYRKIGLVDEAIEICNEGLAVHPDFAGGKVALARALFDKGSHAEVRDLLGPIIDRAPDNIAALRLFADSSLRTGHLGDALKTYKLLLYFNPDDREAYAVIRELETKDAERGGVVRMDRRPEKVQKLIKLQKLLEKVQKAQSATPRI